MKYKIIFILAIILTSIFLSCKKQVENGRPEFIGLWHCRGNDDNHYEINIDNDSYAVYSEISNAGEGNSHIKGIAIANKRRLKIGRIYSFKILEYPHKIDTANSNIVISNDNHNTYKKANWKMTLNGPALHLGGGDYYKADY